MRVTINTIGFLLVAVAAMAASRSVWDGVYSTEQASRGETAYNSKCARCHGDNLLGGENSPPLVDKDFLERSNGKTVGALVDLTIKTMPADGPGKLARQQTTEIAAYMLKSNGFPAGKSDLPSTADALNEIEFRGKP